jgi:hypothetical protein
MNKFPHSVQIISSLAVFPWHVGTKVNLSLGLIYLVPRHEYLPITVICAICEPTVQNMWEPPRLTMLWASMAYYRDSFTFIYYLHWSLYWVRWIQAIPLHPISLRSIWILSSLLRLASPSGFFPSRFTTKTLYAFVAPMRATCPAHPILLDLLTLIIYDARHYANSSEVRNFHAPTVLTPVPTWQVAWCVTKPVWT